MWTLKSTLINEIAYKWILFKINTENGSSFVKQRKRSFHPIKLRELIKGPTQITHSMTFTHWLKSFKSDSNETIFNHFSKIIINIYFVQFSINSQWKWLIPKCFHCLKEKTRWINFFNVFMEMSRLHSITLLRQLE